MGCGLIAGAGRGYRRPAPTVPDPCTTALFRLARTACPRTTVLRLLICDGHLPQEIARDPWRFLGRDDDGFWGEHRAAARAFWRDSGNCFLPDGPENLIWLRGKYYLGASLAPYPSHVQEPTGLNANIWHHGFAQDMYYVVENLSRLGLDARGRAQYPIWTDDLPAVLPYTKRLTRPDGSLKTCADDPRPPGSQKHPVQLNPVALLPLPDFIDGCPAVLPAWEGQSL